MGGWSDLREPRRQQPLRHPLKVLASVPLMFTIPRMCHTLGVSMTPKKMRRLRSLFYKIHVSCHKQLNYL